MSVSTKVGSFSKNTGTGTQAITGVGFKPAALIVWTAGGTTADTWVTTMRHSFGIGASNGSRVISAYSIAGDPTGDLACRGGAEICTFISASGSTVAVATLSSLDADGFTLNWTSNDGSAYLMHYVAVGGSEIQASVVEWQAPTVTGNLATTGVGFKPTAILTACTSVPGGSTPGAGNDTGRVSIGFADRYGQQGVVSVDNTEGFATTNAGLSTACINVNNIHVRASWVSMDTDGFTLNYTTVYASQARPLYALCFRGASIRCGNFTKTTGAATASQTVIFGSKPKAVFFATACKLSDVSGDSRAVIGLGATDGVAEEASVYTEATDMSAASDTNAVEKTTKCIIKANNDTQTVDAECDFSSFNDDGFTLSWTTNDAVATQIFYLSIGEICCPEIAGTATTDGTVATANASVTLPSTARIEPGDLLLVLHRSADGTADHGYPAGWNALFSSTADGANDRISLAWKKADGTESSPITITQTSSKFASAALLIKYAADPTLQPPQISSEATGSTDVPNPNTLTPTGGSKPYLWLWVGGWEGEQTSPPASNPTSFELSKLGADSGTGGATATNCRVAVVGRALIASSQDPAAWTISAADDWTAYTVAIETPGLLLGGRPMGTIGQGHMQQIMSR